MPNFNIGDKIKIIYHSKGGYIGKQGKIVFTGRSLKSSTMPIEDKYGDPDLELRYGVQLEDGTIVSDLREVQLLNMVKNEL